MNSDFFIDQFSVCVVFDSGKLELVLFGVETLPLFQVQAVVGVAQGLQVEQVLVARAGEAHHHSAAVTGHGAIVEINGF